MLGRKFAGKTFEWIDKLYPFRKQKETIKLSWMSEEQ